MAKGNPQNYGKLEAYLAKNDIEYEKLSEHHYRVLGAGAIVDIWPSRMTIHIIQTEGVDPNKYFKMWAFNEKKLTKILDGGL